MRARELSVFDADARVHRYDVDMELISTALYSLDAVGGGRGYQRDCNPQGYVVATGWGDPRAQSKPGYFVATAPVVLFRGMEVVHDFGERLSSERVGTTAPDGTLTGSGPHPFGRETVVALGHDRVYLGSEESYEIEVYDLTGAPLEPIRWSGPALDYDHDLIDRLTEAAIDRAPERSRRAVRTWYRDLPELDQVPAYDRIVVSDEGQVWVRQFVRPGSSGVTWVIFSHAQELIGQLTLPPRSTLWEVRGDRVVYSTPDEYDVPVVRISRVERAGGP